MREGVEQFPTAMRRLAAPLKNMRGSLPHRTEGHAGGAPRWDARWGALAVAVVLGLLAGESEAQAQSDAPGAKDRVRAVSAAHERAQRSHLWRVAAWGGANLAAGTALMLGAGRSAHPARFGYGLQSGIWGAVNLGIAGVGLAGGPGAPTDALSQAVASVRGYHDVLLLNMGLNVAYAGVGAAMLVAGYRDVRSAAAWRGHGTALIVQGVGLLVLDGIALWGARGRLSQLLDWAGEATLSVGPAGAHLLLRL
jgi:hypothetical protein